MVFKKMLAVWLLTIVCITSNFVSVVWAQDETYENYITQGITLYEDNKLQEATIAFDNAIKLDATKSEPYFYKGLILQSYKRYTSAIQQYDIAIKNDPNNAEAIVWKGNCLEELGKNEEALVFYDYAILTDPNFATPYILKGLILKKIGKFDEAKNYIETAVKIDPTIAFVNSDRDITLQIDNPYMSISEDIKEIDLGKGTTPVIINDSTLLPIRSLIEELGGKVEWIDTENKIVIKVYSKTIELFINQKTAIINGEKNVIDIPPIVINDRTFFPLRYISETIGCDVNWDEIGQYINIKLDNVNLGTFQELNALFEIHNSRWFFWEEQYSKGFNNIRNHLGDSFEEELFKFIDNDIENSYWCGNYLLMDVYLDGNNPWPELALKVYDKGLSMTPDAQDNMFMVNKVSLCIIAAIENSKYGNAEKAKSLKAQAEKFMKEDTELLYAFPAISEEDRKIYESL